MDISLIVAMDNKGGISKNGMIPWHITQDMQFFTDVTTRKYKSLPNVLIMGKNTWLVCKDNIKNRFIIVISSTLNIDGYKDTYLVNTFEKALSQANNMLNNLVGHIFICGGAKIYEEAMKYNINSIYLTTIDHDYQCDNMININIDQYRLFSKNTFQLINNNQKVNVTFKKLYLTLPDHWKDCEERQYLNLLNDVLTTGDYRQTRNSKTWSKFGKTLEFDLIKLPLLTCKKWFFKGALLEMLFFLKGDTNTNHLVEQGIKFWEGNTSREFIDSVGLDYEPGDFGNMYGFQLRHFNAEYKGMNYHYTEGFDQVQYCIDLLKTDVYSRRIMMTTYNPAHAKYGTLYPCHGNIIIFNVVMKNNLYYLSCMMTQRSSDLGCALAINTTEYALLVHMICEVINNDESYMGLKFTPGRLIMNLGDAHIYETHYNQMVRQILRDPYDLPTLKINRKVTDLKDFKYEDFEIDYCSYPPIQCKMVA